MNGLFSAIMVQRRVIWALLMRELHTRYGRENIGFLWVIGEPILFCGGVTILWTAIRPAQEHGIPMTAFVITGYVPLTMWRHCLFRSIKAFESNGSLLFHRQVTPLDLILSRIILEIIGSLVAGLLVILAAIAAGFMRSPADYGMLYLGLAIHILFCFGFALVIAPLSERSDIVEKSIQVLAYLAIPFTGAFTMEQWLPERLREFLLWSPMVDSIEIMREGAFGPMAHSHYSTSYDFGVSTLLLLVGLSMTLRIRRHILVQ